MNDVHQQNPDGTWTPVEPLGWQGSGLDWEETRTPGGFEATLYDKYAHVATVRSRWRWALRIKQWRISNWEAGRPG